MAGPPPHDPPPPLAGDGAGSPAPPDLEIRPPAVVERRAWRMLLPEAAASADACRALVAVAPFGMPGVPEQPRVIGAIAVGDSFQGAPIQWPRVCIHVIPPMRRRGVANALLHAAARAGSRRGLGRGPDGRPGPLALAAWSLVSPGDAAAEVWRSIGFTEHVTFCEHEVSLRRVEDRLAPLHDQMRQSGWIPDDARVIPLAQASADQREQLVALHVEHLGGSAALLRQQLAASRRVPFDPDLSMLLLRDGRTVGFTLGRVQPDGVCSVDATVLHPAHRLSWANLLLRLTAGRLLMSRGVTTARFQSCEQHADTRKFARHTGAVLKREQWLMFRVFAPPPRPAGNQPA
jgi:GNAT superfamily N-acetyltransferase